MSSYAHTLLLLFLLDCCAFCCATSRARLLTVYYRPTKPILLGYIQQSKRTIVTEELLQNTVECFTNKANQFASKFHKNSVMSIHIRYKEIILGSLALCSLPPCRACQKR